MRELCEHLPTAGLVATGVGPVPVAAAGVFLSVVHFQM